MYPMKVIHKSKENISALAMNNFKKVGIPKAYFSKFPMMLSGGEQQRVAIARALSSKKNFILADEPTGNLDRENNNTIIRLFRKCVDQGYCVIIVTHNLDIACKADIIYKIVDGKLVNQQPHKGEQ